MPNDFVKFCLSSTASGLLISLSAFMYICTKWINDLIKRNSLTMEIFNILGSILFSFGLFIICKFKLDLFTGRIGFAFEKKMLISNGDNNDNKCTINYWMKLVLMLTINIISSIICGIIAYTSLQKTHYASLIQTIILNRINFIDLNSYILTFMQSIFCGTCVHLAVKSNKYSSIFSIFFTSAFVYNGFQHCIANAFYFASYYKKFNIKMLINECIVIIGNIIGTLPISLLVNIIQHQILSDIERSPDSNTSLDSSSSLSSNV